MSRARLRILAIEDDLADARMLRYAMQGAVDFRAQITIVRELSTALSMLRRWTFDLVLVDLNLPDSSGLPTLHRLRAAAPDQAIVIVTGTDDLELATEGLQAGALDFIVKGQMSGHFLVRAFQYALERHRLERQVHEKEQKLLHVGDELLANASYELRTPLSVVDQAAELLAAGHAGPLNDEQRTLIDMLRRNVVSLERVADDFLVSIRLGDEHLTIRREPVRVEDVLRAAIAEASPESARAGVGIDLGADASSSRVLADAARVRQVFTALLQEAIARAPRGHDVPLRVDRGEPAGSPLRILIGLASEGPAVRDTYDGLVERTVASRGPVAAHRLASARRVMAAHGGDVVLETGGGEARFVITWPRPDLRELLSPVIRRLERREEYCVLRLRFRAQDAEEIAPRWLDEIHRVIESCLVAELDVVLPFVGDDDPRVRRVAVVAHAGRSSAEILVERMETALSHRLPTVEVTSQVEDFGGETTFTRESPDTVAGALLDALRDEAPWSEDLDA